MATLRRIAVPHSRVTPLSTSHETWTSPLSGRYASEAMRRNFSDLTRHRHWRRLWLALAQAEQALGLDISDAQIAELEQHLDDVDHARAGERERELRHDVMAHVHALGEQAPTARPIIHLGATSCFVTDNSELIQIRDGLQLLLPTLWATIDALARFAREHRDLPTLGYTHFQPAQPTTVGRRACLWLQDLLVDAYEIERVLESLRFRGVKGTTGTQASFLALFDGDHSKVTRLDADVTARMGFGTAWPVTGQTYTRKQDFTVIAALAGLGQSASKMATDLRLLSHLKEVEEPYGKSQIGSSAMPYKRNPMRCERMCALSRHLQGLLLNPAETASTQWFERTLDDSANRRLSMPPAFLTADAILNLALDVTSGLIVHPKVVGKHLAAELPFMASETILMAAVRSGGDRQTLHESIRVHSLAAGARVKEEGADNDLLERLVGDPLFASVRDDLETLCDPVRFIGRAPEQVDDFLSEHVDGPLADRRESWEAVIADVRV